jgi:hypothetical protein
MYACTSATAGAHLVSGLGLRAAPIGDLTTEHQLLGNEVAKNTSPSMASLYLFIVLPFRLRSLALVLGRSGRDNRTALDPAT